EGSMAFQPPALRAPGAESAPEHLFAGLSAAMCGRLAEWDRGRGFATIRNDWLIHARGIGEPIAVRNGDAEIRGRFVCLDSSGRLVLERPDGGITKIAAGDVFPFTVRGQDGSLAQPG